MDKNLFLLNLFNDLIIDFELIYENPLIRKEEKNLNLVTVI